MSYLSKQAREKEFKRNKRVPCSVKFFNYVIDTIKRCGGTLHFQPYMKSINGHIGFDGYIDDRVKYILITCKNRGDYCTYVCDKSTGNTNEATRACYKGMHAYTCMVRMLKDKKDLVPVIVKDEDLTEGKNLNPFSTSPFLYYNPEHDGTRTKAYGYDMNSAYSYAMLQPIPDTRELKTCKIPCYNTGIVGKNQIGFDINGNLVDVGKTALYRFNTIPSPFGPFVNYYFKKKSEAKNPKDRQQAKDVLNMAVGYLQRKNPFIRSCIVGRANKLIQDLMDKNTIYCNTDSIVSTTPRKDLVIGTDIGQWKIEHKGQFAYYGFNYQWNKEIPAYRGVPKEWFKRGWDILVDEIPHAGNLYEFDQKKLKLVKVKREVLQ